MQGSGPAYTRSLSENWCQPLILYAGGFGRLMIPWIRNCAEGLLMRGADERSGSLFSHVDLETRVPKDHPLRAIREIVNATLSDLSAEFEAMYAALWETCLG